MENVADKLLQVLAAFGLGVVLVLGVGFWLFHRMKGEAEKRDASEVSQKANRPTGHP